jgi:hypothetical protein
MNYYKNIFIFIKITGEIAVPLLFQVMELLFVGFIPPGGTLYIHPIAFASEFVPNKPA